MRYPPTLSVPSQPDTGTMSNRERTVACWNRLMARTCSHPAGAGTYCVSCCREALNSLCAGAEGVWLDADDEACCAVCGVPLSTGPRPRCARGACGAHPMPTRFFAPNRACREYQRMVLDTGTCHQFYELEETALHTI